MPYAERPEPAPLSNPRADRVKDVARLSGRSGRLKRGHFLAEGPQAVKEALRAHTARYPGSAAVVVDVYATRELLNRDAELGPLLDGVRLREATEDVLSAMADTVHPQGILAVCRQLHVGLETVLRRSPRLIAVLCRVQDPGNAGTILRAADAAGADAVILTASSVDIYNPKAVRSTAGSLFHLPVVINQDFAALAKAAEDHDLTLLAADGYGSLNLDQLQDESAQRRFCAMGPTATGQGRSAGSSSPRLEQSAAWLFGNEAAGLSESELAASDFRISVPIYGQAESLNVGTAATVCLYASARAQQRFAQ